jgi:hypothetical protein
MAFRAMFRVLLWLLLCVVPESGATASRGILGAFFTDSYPSFLAPHPLNIAFAILGNVTAVLALIATLLAHQEEAARELSA